VIQNQTFRTRACAGEKKIRLNGVVNHVQRNWPRYRTVPFDSAEHRRLRGSAEGWVGGGGERVPAQGQGQGQGQGRGDRCAVHCSPVGLPLPPPEHTLLLALMARQLGPPRRPTFANPLEKGIRKFRRQTSSFFLVLNHPE